VNPSPETIAVAAILFVVLAAYALFGGADFGGGIWDLVAGGPERGAAPRELIDESITPVWEANHVWLVFILVLLWTAFPPAFAAIMTALFVPLSLSLLGIVLRGVGFAFRHTAHRLRVQQFTGATFAASSLITPFFMGTVVGAVATGAVPVHPGGNVLAAWTSPTAILTGFLFVAACAYVSAVFLVLEARQRGRGDLMGYFALRATAAGAVTGGLAGGTFFELSRSAPYVYHRLTGIALPLVAVSIAAGIAVLVMLWLRWHHPLILRATAAIAVATVVWGWGLAQYPYLFPTTLTLPSGSAPTATLDAEFVVAGLAVVLVVPGFALLYYLQQRGLLTESESDADLRLAGHLRPDGPAGQAAATPREPIGARIGVAAVLVALAARAIRNVFAPGPRRLLGGGDVGRRGVDVLRAQADGQALGARLDRGGGAAHVEVVHHLVERGVGVVGELDRARDDRVGELAVRAGQAVREQAHPRVALHVLGLAAALDRAEVEVVAVGLDEDH
jgi:cytochrome d ubiquinol oxidase subunit II